MPLPQSPSIVPPAPWDVSLSAQVLPVLCFFLLLSGRPCICTSWHMTVRVRRTTSLAAHGHRRSNGPVSTLQVLRPHLKELEHASAPLVSLLQALDILKLGFPHLGDLLRLLGTPRYLYHPDPPSKPSQTSHIEDPTLCSPPAAPNFYNAIYLIDAPLQLPCYTSWTQTTVPYASLETLTALFF